MFEHQSSDASHQASDTSAQCDPALLQEWVARSGLDEIQIARQSCLSLPQVRQLLRGETSLFYTPAIRYQAYRRVMGIVGAPVPVAAPVAAQPLPSTVSPVPSLPAGQWPRFFTNPWTGVAVLLLAGAAYLHRTDVALPTPAASPSAPAALAVPLNQAPAVDEASATDAPGAAGASSPSPSAAPAWQPELPRPAPEPSVPPATAAAMAAAPADCRYAIGLPQVQSTSQAKDSDYVHLVASRDVQLCVVDGQRRVTQVQLAAGQSRSVYGAAPWQVHAPDWRDVKVFFRGERMRLPEDARQGVELVAAQP